MPDACTQLAYLSRARQAIEKARDMNEVKDIRDKAESIRRYVKAQGESLEIQNTAAEVKLRAERKAGELLADMKFHGGDRRSKSSPHRADLKSLGVGQWNSERWQKVASLPANIFEVHIEKTKAAKREITTAAVLTLAKSHTNKIRNAESSTPLAVSASTPSECSTLESLAAAGHKFACIMADPPWSYGNQATRASTDNHYSTMTVEAIAAMPVGELAADRAHLWLWTTNGFLFECPKLFAAWGFEFKSSYIWCKRQIGIGNYLRNAHEFLLLAVRGGMVGAAKDVKSWGEFDRTAHSAKPERIRADVVERVSPGPRLELFGRKLVPGWTVFGNQIERTMFDPAAEVA